MLAVLLASLVASCLAQDALTALNADVDNCRNTFLIGFNTFGSDKCLLLNEMNFCLSLSVGKSIKAGLSTAQAKVFIDYANAAFSLASNNVPGCSISNPYEELQKPLSFDDNANQIVRTFTDTDVYYHKYTSSSFRIVDVILDIAREEIFSAEFTTAIEELVDSFVDSSSTTNEAAATNLGQNVVSIVDALLVLLNPATAAVGAAHTAVNGALESGISQTLHTVRAAVTDETLAQETMRSDAVTSVLAISGEILEPLVAQSNDLVVVANEDQVYLDEITNQLTDAINSFVATEASRAASEATVSTNFQNNIPNVVSSALNASIDPHVSTANSYQTTLANSATFIQIQTRTGSTDNAACMASEEGQIYHSTSGSTPGFYVCNGTLWNPFNTFRSAAFSGSAILDFTMGYRLSNMLKYNNWARCYSSALHGWQSSDFRTLCSNRGPTVTIAKEQSQGRVFGGYNANPWFNDNRGGYGGGSGSQNFLFRYHNANFDWFGWNGGSYYTYEHNSYGPCFSNAPSSTDLCFNNPMNTGYAYFNNWYYFHWWYNYYGTPSSFGANYMVPNGNTFSVSALEVWYKV